MLYELSSSSFSLLERGNSEIYTRLGVREMQTALLFSSF